MLRKHLRLGRQEVRRALGTRGKRTTLAHTALKVVLRHGRGGVAVIISSGYAKKAHQRKYVKRVVVATLRARLSTEHTQNKNLLFFITKRPAKNIYSTISLEIEKLIGTV